MQVQQHRLMIADGEAIRFQHAAVGGGLLQNPRFLVMHYTAGRGLEESIAWFTKPRARASAHVVIGRSGEVVQLRPFDKVAWHAGRSRWKGHVGLNQWSLGIELDNAGRLVRTGGGWETWFGRKVPLEDVVEIRRDNWLTGWHRYTEAQLDSAMEVGSLLVEHYQLRDVLGHSDIAPRRKVDPGPAFPMPSFRAALLGRGDDDDADELLVTTRKVNIRKGPGLRHDCVRPEPLPRGVEVAVLQEHGAWCLVDAELDGDSEGLQGWVHGRFLGERTA